MSVRRELSLWRLLAALVLLAALPMLATLVAAMAARPELPPGPASYNPLPLTIEPLHRAWMSRDLQRGRRLAEGSVQQAGPALEAPQFPETLPTVVLPARAQPYDLAELQHSFPAVFETTDQALLVRANIDVATGARLVVDAATTPDVRLLSSAAEFVSVIAWGGAIDVQGTEQAPARISSWDPDVGAADSHPADGRSYLLAVGGQMDIDHGDLGHLGFGTGTTSGVAWRGQPLSTGGPIARVFGNVTHSVLHDNWFGAYTWEAQGMKWVGNSFVDNLAYGFDPHDLSNDFLVEGNVAHGNGRHGFIFSRGCDRNMLRDNVAYDNRGHGFMIDDGRSLDASFAPARFLASNDNELIGNRAYDNDGSGIEIEGGTGTVITGNVLSRNHVGVRIKNDASALISDNRISDSQLAGVDVLSSGEDVKVAGNEVTGGWTSVALGKPGAARVTGNDMTGASTALVIDGVAQRDAGLGTAIGQVLRWNPLLVLWVGILGVPGILAVHRLARWLLLRRRGARAVTG
ncbi:MAG TPA: right-handed parallel beta-helix repeat-containing protein [Modestobacter sp.]|nr:right-handed parallel beta-helix repeat-containing protein [Modestobacter sp.]